MIVHHFTTPITTPFARKSTRIYGDLRRLWEKAKIKESAKKPEITGLCRLIKGYKIMIKVLFICHGNICRSTLSESVFTYKVKELGLSDRFVIDSAATSTEEIGNPPHRGTVNKLRETGIPLVPHRARQISLSDYDKFDYIIGMDTANIRNLNRILKGDPEGKVYKFLSFAGSGRDIADPWYTGDFDATYNDVIEGCEGFLEYLKQENKI